MAVPNFDQMSFAQLVAAFTQVSVNWAAATQQFKAWASGTPDGGPSGDGRYPLSDGLGNTFLVYCPAMFAGEVVTGEVEQARDQALAAAAAAQSLTAPLARTLFQMLQYDGEGAAIHPWAVDREGRLMLGFDSSGKILGKVARSAIEKTINDIVTKRLLTDVTRKLPELRGYDSATDDFVPFIVDQDGRVLLGWDKVAGRMFGSGLGSGSGEGLGLPGSYPIADELDAGDLVMIGQGDYWRTIELALLRGAPGNRTLVVETDGQLVEALGQDGDLAFSLNPFSLWEKVSGQWVNQSSLTNGGGGGGTGSYGIRLAESSSELAIGVGLDNDLAIVRQGPTLWRKDDGAWAEELPLGAAWPTPVRRSGLLVVPVTRSPSTSTGTPGLGTAYALPLAIQGVALAGLKVVVAGTAVPGAKVRLTLLEADEDGLPGATIYDSGELAASALGDVLFDFPAPVAGRNRVWAALQQSGDPTLLVGSANANASALIGATSTTAAATCLNKAKAFGAMGASWGGVYGWSTTSVMIFGVQQ